jgi:hypothetical protein
MSHLTYEPLHPSDIPLVQAMVQGTSLSDIQFNTHAEAIMVARQKFHLVGAMLGHKGYGKDSHILTIARSYLCSSFSDPVHQQEMQLSFINWAKDKLNVTHYRKTNMGTVTPIGIDRMIPPLSVENRSLYMPAAQEFIYS